MTDPSLLARVKAATGPDRELDLDLARTLVPNVIVQRQNDDDSGHSDHTYWKYTGSIDDALALVERMLPEWGWSVHRDDDGFRGPLFYWADITRLDRWPKRYGCRGATPPLAILAALITAMIERGRE